MSHFPQASSNGMYVARTKWEFLSTRCSRITGLRITAVSATLAGLPADRKPQLKGPPRAVGPCRYQGGHVERAPHRGPSAPRGAAPLPGAARARMGTPPARAAACRWLSVPSSGSSASTASAVASPPQGWLRAFGRAAPSWPLVGAGAEVGLRSVGCPVASGAPSSRLGEAG